ncbi:MAG: respiratory nitrate reductase subunit gamma [candidate division Zixibacteria bacterium]|nr:respiratory nitrate reductase subunit gamma [candidate division Zixibacteria bacterium]
MYEFSRGPLVWIAFAILFVGSVYRIVSAIVLARKDKVVLPYMKWKFSLRSLFHWSLPFGSHNMRIRPAFTVLSFLFHGCLLLTPLLTLGHVALVRESWGISWWSLPDGLSTMMTILVIIVGVFFVLRRIADPTVRFVTSYLDFVLVILVLAPFVTGLMAYYQVGNYETVMIVHMWAGAIWLAMIPFTRIAHMLFFPLTRAYMGCEFGHVRSARDW